MTSEDFDRVIDSVKNSPNFLVHLGMFEYLFGEEDALDAMVSVAHHASSEDDIEDMWLDVQAIMNGAEPQSEESERIVTRLKDSMLDREWGSLSLIHI